MKLSISIFLLLVAASIVYIESINFIMSLKKKKVILFLMVYNIKYY